MPGVRVRGPSSSLRGASSKGSRIRPSAHITIESEDTPMPDAGNDPTPSGSERRLILGLDYGTTTSSLSIGVIHGNSMLDRTQVQCVTNFPNDPLEDVLIQDGLSRNTSTQVPSDVWYPDKETLRAESFDDGPSEVPVTGMELDDNGNSHVTNTTDVSKGSYRRDVPSIARWGFEAQPSTTYSRASDFLNKRNAPIKWIKLRLADGNAGKAYPLQTHKAFNALKKDGIVLKELDFITDFLTGFLKHAKSELQKSHDLQDDEVVEMTLCVPVAWESKVNRYMLAALTAAMKNSGLRFQKNLFLISEAEAAASFVLHGDFGVGVRALALYFCCTVLTVLAWRYLRSP
jgi:hypothetical protein